MTHANTAHQTHHKSSKYGAKLNTRGRFLKNEEFDNEAVKDAISQALHAAAAAAAAAVATANVFNEL
jgi:hypothetical protein